MSLIIFVGDRSSGYFAEEVAQSRGFDYKCVLRKSNIKDQVNDILFTAAGKADYIIFDVEQYISSSRETAEEIKRVCMAVNAKPIAYLPAFIPESEMARALIDNDIKAFVLSGSATDLKDQLEKNMNGYFDMAERQEIKKIKEIQEEEQVQKQQFKTIGVAGVCHRIGTTTQAMQIVKYLSLKGYKACLIEVNENKYKDTHNGSKNEIGFVEKIAAWFEVDKEDEEEGFISSFGIDMFYKQSKIPDILKKGYDYYVYDYGCYTSRGFNKTAFIREDMKFFVVGSSVTELDYTKDIAENIFYSDAKLLFSFTAKEEEEDLLFLMNSIKVNENKGNAARTYFTSFCPDPFTLSEEAVILFEEILPVENLNEKPVNRKKTIFGRRSNKKSGKI